MRIIPTGAVGGVCLAFVLSGCTFYTYTSPISKDEQPTASDTFLYGRFAIRAPTMLLESHPSMGFALACKNAKTYTVSTYTIHFSTTEPIQVIKIPPGACSLREIVYTNADGTLVGRKPVPPELGKAFEVNAATAYYLGDITSVRDDYERTTQEMDATFPNLSSLPCENRMLGK
jgi:hypothetical protein